MDEELETMRKELEDMDRTLLKYTLFLASANVRFRLPLKNLNRLKENNPVSYKKLCEYLELEEQYQEKRKRYKELLEEKFQCHKVDSPQTDI